MLRRRSKLSSAGLKHIMAKKAKRAGIDASACQTHTTLTAGRRTLTVPGRTIAIAAIATISIGRNVSPRSPFIAAAALAMAAGAGGLAASFGLHDLSFAVPAALALVLFILYLWPQDKTQYLLITTSDGTLTRFAASSPEMLEDARMILAAKIDSGEDAGAIIDFEAGTIEPVAGEAAAARLEAGGAHTPPQIPARDAHAHGTAGHGAHAPGAHGHGSAEASHAGTHVNGASARAASTAVHAHGVNGSGARHEQPPQQPRVQTAPPAQPMPAANGSAHSPQDHYIDFSQYLPAVVDMHRFYARQQNTEHLEQRLSELELLMRAGAPGAHQKTRLRELTGELSQILQPYPQVVQIFNGIAHLSGHV